MEHIIKSTQFFCTYTIYKDLSIVEKDHFKSWIDRGCHFGQNYWPKNFRYLSSRLLKHVSIGSAFNFK